MDKLSQDGDTLTTTDKSGHLSDAENLNGTDIKELDEESNTNDNVSTDESDDDDEEDKAPPLLKYTRITTLQPFLFNKDPVSTCIFHDNHYFFATHSGTIHITTPELKPLRTFKAHRASVLSLYTDGNYFASGSIDGTVVIGSIEDTSDITAYDFQRPIHGVVLEPNYNKGRGFITGGMSGKVIYTSKNWLGKRSDIVIEEGHGPIVSLQLVNDMIIWMNDYGITICQFSTKQLVKKITKPQDAPRSDMYWPKVSFPESDRILIGWGNHIWQLRVSTASNDDTTELSVLKVLPSSASFRSTVYERKQVTIEHFYKMDTLISGITSFKDDLWLVLAYIPPKDDEKTGKKRFFNPELRLINSTNGEVEFEEEIGMKEISNLGSNDYSLSKTTNSPPSYFIISARDGISVREYQMQDRLDWYISNGKFLEAWEISTHLVSWKVRLGYGIKHVDSLIEENKWDEASRFLPCFLSLEGLEEVNEDNEEREIDILKNWELFANIFVDSGHIKELSHVLPQRIQIPSTIYQKILEYWLDESLQVFYDLVLQWDTNLYDVKRLQNSIELKLESDEFENDKDLRICLTQLYERSNDHRKAVEHLIKLKNPDLVEYLFRHHLIEEYIDKLPLIVKLRLDENQLQPDGKVEIASIEERLKDIIILFFKLDRERVLQVFRKDMDYVNYLYFKLEKELGFEHKHEADKYDDEKIRLFCKYNRQLILPLLREKGKSINIETNIELFQKLKFWEELIFLYEEIGEIERCITIIIDELDDHNLIVKFLRNRKAGSKVNEVSLWNQLIEKSQGKPKFIKTVLENLDEEQYSSPEITHNLKKIDFNGLNDTLHKVFDKMDMTVLTNQVILKIVNYNSNRMSKELRNHRLIGTEIVDQGM